jgi:hypothetical protein
MVRRQKKTEKKINLSFKTEKDSKKTVKRQFFYININI